MFISSAMAAGVAETAAQSQTISQVAGSFAPLLIIIVIFYFFLVRPQQRKMTEFQRLVSGLRRGDRIVTSGGIIGTVHRVETTSPEIILEIAENVRVRVQRNAVAEILAKTEPVKGEETQP